MQALKSKLNHIKRISNDFSIVCCNRDAKDLTDCLKVGLTEINNFGMCFHTIGTLKAIKCKLEPAYDKFLKRELVQTTSMYFSANKAGVPPVCQNKISTFSTPSLEKKPCRIRSINPAAARDV